MKNKLMLIVFILLTSTCNANEFNRLRDTFGGWNVRHVYDDTTLHYRFSDAKTKLTISPTISPAMSLPFQINRSAEGKFSFLFMYAVGKWEDINLFHDWITKTIFYIDDQKYEFKSNYNVVHTFEGNVDKNFLSAVAQANFIKIDLFVGDSLVAEGTIPTNGSYAALKWLRAL